jgi:hypothetical protein
MYGKKQTAIRILLKINIYTDPGENMLKPPAYESELADGTLRADQL